MIKNGHNYFVELTVNGDRHMVLVSAKTTLVEVLREQLGLTGTKLGCGVGDCGACTILLDGEPANACLLLALEAEGRDIITIEGISTNGELHPLQRAFVNEGAIQCGFCTPAMVLTGKALVNKNADPSEKEVREALAGTFCRCTGYAKIVKAIRNWQHYNEMPSSKEEGGKTELAVVGKSLPRKDSFDKVTGRARYTDDIHLPNMLYGKILTSPYSHARILNIDTQKAEVLQGVKAILTGKNVPDIFYGVSPARYDEHILAKEKVCYVGDEVAAVAAIDEETCQKALELIEVEYEELPAVFDPIEAMQDGAPLILERYPNNINTRVDWNFGDVEKGFKEADLVLSDTYVGNRTYQSPMEPHCAIAEWDSDGRLKLYTSTQVVHYVRYQLSRLLEMSQGDIRVIGTHCGGGFGGKAEVNPLEMCAAFLAKKTGRPVKMRYNRTEMFYHCRGRHKQTIDMKIGMKKDGTITAVQQKSVLEGGAYSSFGVIAVYYSGAMVPTLYKLPHYKYDGFRVNTNLPACGAMRGHGCPHPRFAFESLLTDLAMRLRLDPIEVRLKNAMEPDSRTVNDLDVGSCELKACLEEVRRKSGWDEKWGKLPFGRGIGVGCGGFVSGAGYPIYRSKFPHSNATIKVSEDGNMVILYTGETEIGQGSMTVLSQIAAEAMGITYDRIKVEYADTDITPLGFGSYSSRVTLMGGNACKMAGEDVKQQLLKVASQMINIPIEQIESRENYIYDRENENAGIPWEEVAARYFSEKGPLIGRGHYSPPEGLGGDFKGATVGTSPAYSFSACVCEVEVDVETGKVKVIKFTDAHDVGTPINPMAVEGQAEGAIAMMLGETLLEDMVFDKKGNILNPNLHDYLLPTALDVPPIDSSTVESYEPRGPFGAKEVGEGATLPVIGAIANAIYDAIGVRVKELPITPERILQALGEKERKECFP
ncbi:MAG: molybdopterin-dependent oxidoreductase [Candidatus Marinimicrobia bacterium]|nr:molybdopterin-dependent oxidoreductase [Candidatus Neomarinimicrobiota bacterium]